MITEEPAPPLDQANSTLVYYGPHECGRCGRLIVKAAREQGGAEYDYPRGPEPIYPNTRWRPHDCPADRTAPSRADPLSDPTMRTHNLSGVDLGDLVQVREAVRLARTVGHWRRILAIYGDHLPACKVRVNEGFCDCGWVAAFEQS